MADGDNPASEFPDPERRAKLRRDTLKLARTFPPGPERNSLRSAAKSLTFFDEKVRWRENSGNNAYRPALPDRRSQRHGR